MSEDVSAPAVDVAALRAALEVATPGPWHWQECSDGWDGQTSQLNAGTIPVLFGWGYDASGIDIDRADAELIVLLRNNAEALLAELEEARERSWNFDDDGADL